MTGGTSLLTIRTGSLRTFAADTLRVVRALRRLRPDAVFDLEFFSKFSTLLAALSGAPRRFAYELPARWRRLVTTDPVPYDHQKHITDVFLDQLPFGAAPASLPAAPRLVVTPADRFSLGRKAGGAARIACMNINAGATSLERRWPRERSPASTRN